MVKYNKALEASITKNVDKKLKSILGFDPISGRYQSRACCCCDRLLPLRARDRIPVKAILRAGWFKPKLDMKYEIIKYYQYNGFLVETFPQLKNCILSPRSYGFLDEEDEAYFDICSDCKGGTVKKPPILAISNLQIGTAPEELTCLNVVELSFISLGVMDRHVFQCYAGQHKSINLWHQMYVNEVEHNMASFRQCDQYEIPDDITCTLSGPFTKEQKEIAVRSMTINREKIIRALKWLIKNNRLYKEIRLPEQLEIPQPRILDHSTTVEGLSSKIETVFETTIIFPQLNEVDEHHTGYESREEFIREVLKDKRFFHMISRPTCEPVKSLDGDNLLKCFPLQFPYGNGSRPEKMDRLKYIRHLANLSEPCFQKAEFLLPLLMYQSKLQLVRGTSIRTNYRVSENRNMEDVINDIDLSEVDSTLNDIKQQSNMFNRKSIKNKDLARLVDAVSAVTKKIPFSDSAAKEERKKLFSLCTEFGMPALFLSICPDDTANWFMKVQSVNSCKRPSCGSNEEIDEYLEECAKVRIEYPGLSTLNFENVIDLVISDIIGWDVQHGCSKTEGGVFGISEAWFTPIEEQRNNTLHTHFLIWIKDWNRINEDIHCGKKEKRQTAKSKITSFVDDVTSTKCFDCKFINAKKNDRLYSLADRIVEHHTSQGCSAPCFEQCSAQKLRNMRYKFCPKNKMNESILTCTNCNNSYTSDDLVRESCHEILKEFGVEIKDRSDLQRLKYTIAQHGLDDCLDERYLKKAEILCSIVQNLHQHTFTCFKKGDEGRCYLPKQNCEQTTFHEYEDEKIPWFSWDGKRVNRISHTMEIARHPMDAFVNQYNPLISCLFGCNTNIQCGIGGAHIMYCSCYATKSNKKEEKQVMMDACQGLLRSLKKEIREQSETESSAAPNVQAFKRLFSAIMASAENYTVGGPLAKFLINRNSRFLCSHSFVPIPFRDFKDGKSTLANLHILRKNKAFLSSSRDAYLFRPVELELLSPYYFYAKYEIVNKPGKKEDESNLLAFHPDAPKAYANLRVSRRDVDVIPLLYHDLMKYDGKNIDGDIFVDENVNDGNRTYIELYCQKVIFLFWNFRPGDEHKIDGSFRLKLKALVENNKLDSDFSEKLQNMQNCKNSLNSHRIPEPLDRKTTAPIDPHEHKEKKAKTTSKEVRDHIDEKLSGIITEINDAFASAEKNANKNFSVNEVDNASIRQRISGRKGVGDISPPDITGETHHFIEVESEEEETEEEEQSRKRQKVFDTRSFKALDVEKLLEVHAKSIKRNIATTVGHNVEATGTPVSIDAWADSVFYDEKTKCVDENQKRAFQSIVSQFVLQYMPTNYTRENNTTNARSILVKWKSALYRYRGLHPGRKNSKLTMFLTGAGGSGKSHVIKNVIAYCSRFCDLIEQKFDKRTIVVTALTGVAATTILGETTHSALCINPRTGKVNSKLDSSKSSTLLKDWREVKLLIIDEISFADAKMLESIDNSLRILNQNLNESYGGVPIIFSGDFFQLDPIGDKDLIYTDPTLDLWFVEVNCFIELDGGHRFKDQIYRCLLERLRYGKLTDVDIKLINSRIVAEGGIDLADMPGDIQIACHSNKDRNANNSNVFLSHLRKTHSKNKNHAIPSHTLVIKSSKHKWTHNARNLIPSALQDFFNEVSESDCKTVSDNHFIDPLLKLYIGIPMMLVKNEDVPNGIANGTLCMLHKIVLRRGRAENITPMLLDGYWVNSIEAHDVAKLVVKYGDEWQYEHEITSVNTECKVQFPLNLLPGYTQQKRYAVRMSFVQFHGLVNNCTTVHKLQGQTKDSLYITSWNKSKSWAYVALSRIKTLKGLFIKVPINTTFNKPPPPELLRMMDLFRRTKKPLPVDEYE